MVIKYLYTHTYIHVFDNKLSIYLPTMYMQIKYTYIYLAIKVSANIWDFQTSALWRNKMPRSTHPITYPDK